MSQPKQPVHSVKSAADTRLTVIAGMYFFCLMAAYYALRPMRDSFGAGDRDKLQYLFTGTFLCSLLAQPLYGRLVAKHGRAVFIPIAYRFLIANALIFGVALNQLSGDALLWCNRIFFVWLSFFVVFAVTVFWGFMADIFGNTRAKRLYGRISIGGTLGAILGSSLAGWWVDSMQTLLVKFGAPESLRSAALLPVMAAIFMECAVRAARALEKLQKEPSTEPDAPSLSEAVDGQKPVGGSAWAGFRGVARSPYLLGICAYVAIFVVGSTLLYYINSVITKEAFPEASARTAFFGKVDLAVNGLTLFLQLFATGKLLQRYGVGIALAAVPLVGVLGFSAVAISPTLSVLVCLFVARRGLEFGLSKPGRETLFTSVSREEKFKAKAVIDTAVYRGGDAAAMWMQAGLTSIGIGVAGFAWGLVGLCCAGVLLAVYLGRQHQARLASPQTAGI